VENENWLWFIIVHAGVEVGTIWLEREKVSAKEATLGILIGAPERFGNGIGRSAILEILEEGKGTWGLQTVSLNVRQNNTRAIRCYQACQFAIVGQGVKGLGEQVIPYYTMERRA